LRQLYRRAFTGQGFTFGWLQPEAIGALTDSPILSNNVRYNDDGDIVVVPNVWWYPNYMIDDIIEKMYSNGYLIFDKAE